MIGRTKVLPYAGYFLRKENLTNSQISSIDEFNFDECLDSSKVILVEYEFDELNIDVTKNSSNFPFVKNTRRTVYNFTMTSEYL